MAKTKTREEIIFEEKAVESKTSDLVVPKEPAPVVPKESGRMEISVDPRSSDQTPFVPGASYMGRGIRIVPRQPYELKGRLFDLGKKLLTPFPGPLVRSSNYDAGGRNQGQEEYCIFEHIAVDTSPPTTEDQAIRQTIAVDSYEGLDSLLSVDRSVAAGNESFTISATSESLKRTSTTNSSQFLLVNSFIPFWALYLDGEAEPTIYEVALRMKREKYESVKSGNLSEEDYAQQHRDFNQIFDLYGTHYVSRVWVGGRASLRFEWSNSSSGTEGLTKQSVSAKVPGLGGSISGEKGKKHTKSNEVVDIVVVGEGGDKAALVQLGAVDSAEREEAFANWLETVKERPQVISLEVKGIWTLLLDSDDRKVQKKGEVLKKAYESMTTFLRVSAAVYVGGFLYIFRAGVVFSIKTGGSRRETDPYGVRYGVTGSPFRNGRADYYPDAITMLPLSPSQKEEEEGKTFYPSKSGAKVQAQQLAYIFQETKFRIYNKDAEIAKTKTAGYHEADEEKYSYYRRDVEELKNEIRINDTEIERYRKLVESLEGSFEGLDHKIRSNDAKISRAKIEIEELDAHLANTIEKDLIKELEQEIRNWTVKIETARRENERLEQEVKDLMPSAENSDTSPELDLSRLRSEIARAERINEDTENKIEEIFNNRFQDESEEFLIQDWKELTADVFPGMTFPRVDAVCYWAPDRLGKPGKAFFFYWNEYIRFDTDRWEADESYPRKISENWRGVPFDRIDAASVNNGKIHFFRNDQVVRFDMATCTADPGYPKQLVGNYIEEWKGTLFGL